MPKWQKNSIFAILPVKCVKKITIFLRFLLQFGLVYDIINGVRVGIYNNILLYKFKGVPQYENHGMHRKFLSS